MLSFLVVFLGGTLAAQAVARWLRLRLGRPVRRAYLVAAAIAFAIAFVTFSREIGILFFPVISSLATLDESVRPRAPWWAVWHWEIVDRSGVAARR